jgi:hypothetical protein
MVYSGIIGINVEYVVKSYKIKGDDNMKIAILTFVGVMLFSFIWKMLTGGSDTTSDNHYIHIDTTSNSDGN